MKKTNVDEAADKFKPPAMIALPSANAPQKTLCDKDSQEIVSAVTRLRALAINRGAPDSLANALAAEYGKILINNLLTPK